MPSSDLLIAFGGSIKALDGSGRIGGHLIVWGDADTPDISADRDYFTPETDLGRYAKSGIDLYYGHGLAKVGGEPNPLEGRVVGEGEVKADDVGLWLEGQLALRDQYERAVYDKIVSAGKAGLSSGAVPHLVRREPQPNGSNKVVRWPLVEGSITPIPAEPRTSVVALKTLLESPDAADPATFVDACLKSASDLAANAARFAKLGPAKLDALKALRASLDGLIRDADAVDPARLAELRRDALQLVTRFGA